MVEPSVSVAERVTGLLLGTAVGDALGLPGEGLSARRASRMWGGSPLRHRFLAGRGMISDDTEHTCMVAQALLASHGDVDAFARSLAWRLRGWFLGLPAGIGMATAKSIIKLFVGFGPHNSGVWSAGNGPAMRAAIIGAYAYDDLELLRRLVRASTRLTHTDPQAEHGSMAVALAAACVMQSGSSSFHAAEYIRLVEQELNGTAMSGLLRSVAERVQSGDGFREYLASIGCERGISGYINHTVPAAIFCWLRWHGDFRTALEQIVLAGGDTDSTGAIVGGLVGLAGGPDSIPREWVDGLVDWPRTTGWM